MTERTLRYTLRARTVTPGERAPIVHSADIAEEARWGLLPRWRGHGGKRPPMIHAAPLARLAELPLLRDAFARSRCLVLADGYLDRRPHAVWIHPEPPAIIALAGIRAVNRDDDIPSFALVVADGLLVVTDRDAWLDPATDAEHARALVAPPAGWRASPANNPSQGELF
jgi:putative SOS response-associated peptidase YedK